MKLPQIIRFADYLGENPAEAVRTVLYQNQHGNVVLWQIPPQTMLPAHCHPHDAGIWIVLQGKAELTDDAQSGRIIRTGEAVVISDRQIHGARNNDEEDYILVSVISPKVGFEKA